MKRLINNQSGSALAMTLIVMLVLMILGTALLNLSVADNKFAIKNEDKIQAYYIARSGAQAVAEYMINPVGNVNLIGDTSNANTQFANGSFTVNVTADIANPKLIYITAISNFKGTSETAKLKMIQTPVSTNFLFANAIVAANIMSNEGNGKDAKITGDVLATQLSNIFPGPNPATVSGTKNADPQLSTLLADVKVDLTPYPSTSFPITSSYTFNSPSPNSDQYFRISSINMSGGGNTITINGPGTTHLYVEGNVSLTGNAGIFVAANANLCIYKDTPGTIEIDGSGSIINNTYIFAPKANVDLNNNNTDTFRGAIIAKNVNIPNKIEFVHVPMSSVVDLDVSGVGLFFSGYTWID